MTLSTWDQQYQEQRGIRWWPCEELVRFMGRRYAMIPREDRQDIKVLDMGCGTGANASFLDQEGFTVTGIDASKAAIQLASQRVPGMVEGSALHLPEEWTTSFQGVVDIQTIQHLTYTQHLLVYHEVYRVLAPGGFFFSVHMQESHWDFRHGGGTVIDEYTVNNCGGREALFPNNGTTCFLPAYVMKEELDKSGFVVESLEVLMRTYKQRTREARYLVTVAMKD